MLIEEKIGSSSRIHALSLDKEFNFADVLQGGNFADIVEALSNFQFM